MTNTSRPSFGSATAEDSEFDQSMITIPRFVYDRMAETIMSQQMAFDKNRLTIVENPRRGEPKFRGSAYDSYLTEGVKAHAAREQAAETTKGSVIVLGIVGTILTGGVGGLVVGAVAGYGGGKIINTVNGTYANAANHAEKSQERLQEVREIHHRMTTPGAYADLLPYRLNVANEPNQPNGAGFGMGEPAAA